MSLEMAPKDGPAGRDSHVGPKSHSGSQYGMTVKVWFSTLLGEDRPSPFLFSTVWWYGTVEISRIHRHKPDCYDGPVKHCPCCEV